MREKALSRRTQIIVGLERVVSERRRPGCRDVIFESLDHVRSSSNANVRCSESFGIADVAARCRRRFRVRVVVE